MVMYPIKVERDGYRGTNSKRREQQREHNRIAEDLERKINKMIKDNPERVQTLLYSDIARHTGYDRDLVEEMCYSIDCGGNGFTVVKETSETE